jgi:NADH-quinone oxidoreductase subunit K
MNFYLLLGITLFIIGAAGFVIRKNLLVCFMSIELMLNAVNLIFVTYSHFLKSSIGLMYVFFIMAVAAAEVSIGLAIIIIIFRLKGTVDMDKLNTLKG